MTNEEARKILDACDIVCANCDRKHEHAYACDSCVVNEVGDIAEDALAPDNVCPDEPDSEFPYDEEPDDIMIGDDYERI